MSLSNACSYVVILLQQQNPRVLECFRIHFHTPLKMHLHKLYPWIVEEDLDDIINNGFIRALDRGSRFNPDIAKIHTFVSMHVHYEAKNFLMSHGYTTRFNPDLDVPETVTEQQPFHNQQPSLAMEEQFAKAKLTPQERFVVIAFYYQCLTIADIAAECGIQESTVRQQLSRAYAKLRNGS